MTPHLGRRALALRGRSCPRLPVRRTQAGKQGRILALQRRHWHLSFSGWTGMMPGLKIDRAVFLLRCRMRRTSSATSSSSSSSNISSCCFKSYGRTNKETHMKGTLHLLHLPPTLRHYQLRLPRLHPRCTLQPRMLHHAHPHHLNLPVKVPVRPVRL